MTDIIFSGMESADVVEVLVEQGQAVSAGEALFALESDKANMEFECPNDGTIAEILVKVGESIKEGQTIARMTVANAGGSMQAGTDADAPSGHTAETAAPPAPATTSPEPSKVAPSVDANVNADAAQGAVAAPPALSAAPTAQPDTPNHAVHAGKGFHASPKIRAYARTLGVPLGEVQGTGENSRIQQHDVEQFVKARFAEPASASPGAPQYAPAPTIDFSQFGAITHEPLSRIKQRSGAHLARAWQTIPHVTQFEHTDITELEAFRKQLRDKHPDVKITLIAFVIQAVCHALKQFPSFNASLDGEDALVLKHYYHIGVAVDTPNGLVVPVIRDADRMGVLEISAALGELSAKARAGKLSKEDMSGGTFTISSLGGIGGTYFTPIVNAPEVAILGLSRGSLQPVWDGTEFIPRLQLPLSLSYDHRVIDGAEGMRFLAALAGSLSDIRTLLL